MNTNKLDFDFDPLDKRVTQISTVKMTAADRLIYARMLNEYKKYKDTIVGYVPTNTSLAVVGCYAKPQSVLKTIERLIALSLIEKLPTKPRKPCRYIVRTIDEALKLNPDLLSEPTMSERRHELLPLEAKGQSNKKTKHSGSISISCGFTSALKAPDKCFESTTASALKAPDKCFESTHERTYKEKKESFKEQLEGQGQGQNQNLSLDDNELLVSEVSEAIGDEVDCSDEKPRFAKLTSHEQASMECSEEFLKEEEVNMIRQEQILTDVIREGDRETFAPESDIIDPDDEECSDDLEALWKHNPTNKHSSIFSDANRVKFKPTKTKYDPSHDYDDDEWVA